MYIHKNKIIKKRVCALRSAQCGATVCDQLAFGRSLKRTTRSHPAHIESLDGGGAFGSVGTSGAEGGERRESGKRGRRPGRKAQQDKQDMKAKLERSRQSARECRARKKLRYQYLEELVADRERSVLALRKELDKYYKWSLDLDAGRVPEGLEAALQELGVAMKEETPPY